jgi:predicted metal-binding membrane protein
MCSIFCRLVYFLVMCALPSVIPMCRCYQECNRMLQHDIMDTTLTWLLKNTFDMQLQVWQALGDLKGVRVYLDNQEL